jgi:hypothetical protein
MCLRPKGPGREKQLACRNENGVCGHGSRKAHLKTIDRLGLPEDLSVAISGRYHRASTPLELTFSPARPLEVDSTFHHLYAVPSDISPAQTFELTAISILEAIPHSGQAASPVRPFSVSKQ